jgi:hypothetical protein
VVRTLRGTVDEQLAVDAVDEIADQECPAVEERASVEEDHRRDEAALRGQFRRQHLAGEHVPLMSENAKA